MVIKFVMKTIKSFCAHGPGYPDARGIHGESETDTIRLQAHQRGSNGTHLGNRRRAGGVRLTIQVILEREGYEIICAADGDQGLRAFASTLPQLVITDIIMPDKEGLETIMEIRARCCDADHRYVGGGRVGNADFLQMAARLGADEVLPKPFEREDLIGAVRRLLSPEYSGRQPVNVARGANVIPVTPTIWRAMRTDERSRQFSRSD